MFEKYYSEYFLREALVDKADFHPLPRREEREEWDNVDEEARSYYMEIAEKAAVRPVPQLSASAYMEYFENGNRTRFEDRFHARRSNLRDLIIAECCENKGRFRKTVLDYTYAICDEFTWVVPAHNNHKSHGERQWCLPESVQPDFVDLFAGETAAVLAWVSYFFGNWFEEVCPAINDRIRYEVRRRILKPFLDGEAMNWMGLPGKKVNNWVPWIICNCIPAAEMFAEGYEKITLMRRFMEILDRFAGQYQPDGGCDEGPHYWNAAGAALFDALELLSAATAGKIDLFGDELIKNIGEYIIHAHMFENVFINFADGGPVPDVTAGVVYRYGRRIGSEALAAFGAELFKKTGQPDGNRFFAYRTIKNALEFHELKQCDSRYRPEKQTCLRYLEVCASRDEESGIFAACKGGHNDESHNHNDLGAFMVYKNKKPILIDPGCETYTAKTFSPERYDIWTMQSQYHNLPVIGGCMQEAGEQYRAGDVKCGFRESGFDFSLQLEKAYPPRAGVESFERKITSAYGADGYFKVSDRILLKEKKEVKFYLTLADKPELSEGILRVNGAELNFAHGDYSAETETIPLTDEKIIRDWNGRTALYRVAFTPKKLKREYGFVVTVR